jgi:hypothetical protein
MVKHALRMYEDSLCRCGHSLKLTQKPDAHIAYRATTIDCPACAKGESERERERGPGKITYVEDLRDTPSAMEADADDIMWFPDEGTAQLDARYTDAVGLDRYADTTEAAATSSPTTVMTPAISPLVDRASEHSSEK